MEEGILLYIFFKRRGKKAPPPPVCFLRILFFYLIFITFRYMHIKRYRIWNSLKHKTCPNEHISQICSSNYILVRFRTFCIFSLLQNLKAPILVAVWGLTPPPPRLRTGPFFYAFPKDFQWAKEILLYIFF